MRVPQIHQKKLSMILNKHYQQTHKPIWKNFIVKERSLRFSEWVGPLLKIWKKEECGQNKSFLVKNNNTLRVTRSVIIGSTNLLMLLNRRTSAGKVNLKDIPLPDKKDDEHGDC